eukprot:TRINITY_DN1053_c0_g1_i3.p1 TRINITY_DN1053_c0_g1~~TRINITY_DN1053_c0_g1_i3.p1  ORF type:complete len:334 (-),score=30.75 TRINITY_DN1053_c0_g1_i3:58-1059(-)
MGSTNSQLLEDIPEPTTEVTLSVFWCGTAGRIRPPTTQIGMFSKLCRSEEISKQYGQKVETREFGASKHYKISFDGCGNTNGTTGTLFGAGLSTQCDEVVENLDKIIAAGHKVKINCLGLSRGGMGVLMLVKRLARYPPTLVTMNCLLFDPVPGNLITSSSLDLFNQTLASQCMDVSSSRNLANVLAIYPHIPLPDFAFHAPILSKYPPSTKVEEIVSLGCHQGALYHPEDNVPSLISFSMIRAFLLAHETPLALDPAGIKDKQLLETLKLELKHNEPTTRFTHSYVHTIIERVIPNNDIKYLNYYHYTLKAKHNLLSEPFDESSCLLRIIRS